MAITLRNRVKEVRNVPSEELMDNERNWRTHPHAQRRAPRASASVILCSAGACCPQRAPGTRSGCITIRSRSGRRARSWLICARGGSRCRLNMATCTVRSAVFEGKTSPPSQSTSRMTISASCKYSLLWRLSVNAGKSTGAPKRNLVAPKRKAADSPPARSVFQKFEMRQFSRKALTGCDYNPRKIDESAKKKLRNNLNTVGLLQPLVVNIRDARNRIISGHKRIEILDQLEQRDDYLLDCAVVDLDDKTEKEQVVFFNNEQAMGSYDTDLLNLLITTDKDKPNFEKMGFDLSYLKVTLPSFEAPATPARESQEAAVLETAQEIEKKHEEEVAAIKEAKKKGKEAADRRYIEDKNVEFFTVVIFRDRASSDRFADRLRVNRSEKYVSGDLVMQVIDREAAEPGTEAWIPLSTIFGTGRVPEAVATILKQVVAKMVAAGDIGEKNRFQALEYMGTEFLNDPNHA